MANADEILGDALDKVYKETDFFRSGNVEQKVMVVLQKFKSNKPQMASTDILTDEDALPIIVDKITAYNPDLDLPRAQMAVAENFPDLDSKVDELMKTFSEGGAASSRQVFISLVDEANIRGCTQLRKMIGERVNKFSPYLRGVQIPMNKGTLVSPINADTRIVSKEKALEIQPIEDQGSEGAGSPPRPCKRAKSSD